MGLRASSGPTSSPRLVSAKPEDLLSQHSLSTAVELMKKLRVLIGSSVYIYFYCWLFFMWIDKHLECYE